MRAARRNIRRVMKAVRRRFRRLRGGEMAARLKDLESAQASNSLELAQLRADLQMTSVRQQALVDYYETRIDRIYARLSSDLASGSAVSLVVEVDGDADERLEDGFRKVFRLRDDYASISVDRVLSDRLQIGRIEAPLTLQGFRLNRSIARELGDRVLVSGVDEGRSPTALYGPYKKLGPGHYKVLLRMKFLAGKYKKNDRGILFDIFCPVLNKVIASGAAVASVGADEEKNISLEIDWSPLNSNSELELRVHQRSVRSVELLGFEIRVGDDG